MSDLKPSSLKVVELRAELSKRSLPTKGKKDELVARLIEALEAEKNSSSNSEQVIEEPAEKERESAEQEQVVEEQPTNVSQSNDEVEARKVTEQSTEQLIEKPQEQLIEKPQEQLTEKPQEQLIEKPQERLIEKPQEQLIEQPQEQLIEQSQEQLIEKPQEQLIEKPQEQLIEKPQEQLIEKPQEQLIEKPQEQLIVKPDEQLVEKKAENMETDGDSGLKRKRLESNDNEEEKRLKIDDKKEETTEETSALYIKGFVRPLIIKHVQELFAKYGTVKRFWMDSIKTHCYVTYENKLQAKEAFSNVNGIKFPADTGRLLTVGELTSEQADRLIEYEQNAAEKRIKVDWESMISKIKSGEKLASSASSNDDSRRFRSIGIGQITKQLAQAAEPNINSSSPTTTTTTPPKSLPPIQQKQKEISLDDLFKKTKSLPRLYYLPNTDQEAKIKLDKLQQH